MQNICILQDGAGAISPSKPAEVSRASTSQPVRASTPPARSQAVSSPRRGKSPPLHLLYMCASVKHLYSFLIKLQQFYTSVSVLHCTLLLDWSGWVARGLGAGWFTLKSPYETRFILVI